MVEPPCVIREFCILIPGLNCWDMALASHVLPFARPFLPILPLRLLIFAREESNYIVFLFGV